MGRMVRGDGIERAVLQRFDHGSNILRRAQGRVHLEVPVRGAALIEHEIMRRSLRRNTISRRLHGADEIEAQLCADVAEVILHAAFPGKDHVPRGHAGFARRRAAERIILRVVKDGQPCFRRSAHAGKHLEGIRHGTAVLAERTGARGLERRRIHDLFPFLPQGDRADGQGVNALRAGAERCHGLRCVRHGLEVRHHADGRKSARRSRGAAGAHIFFFGEAGIAEMDVQVDQPRQHEHARRIDAFRFTPGELTCRDALPADRRNAALAEVNIACGVKPLRRVNDAPSRDAKVHLIHPSC